VFCEEKCDFCGDCLAPCAYVDYDKGRAASEIRNLIDGKEAPILSRCITCYACNEYCPQEARPFDLVLDRMEEYHSFPAPREMAAAQEQFFTPGTPVKLEKNGDRVMSACVFGNTEAELFQGRLFEGLPILKGRHFFCSVSQAAGSRDRDLVICPFTDDNARASAWSSLTSEQNPDPRSLPWPRVPPSTPRKSVPSSLAAREDPTCCISPRRYC
jgi:ferredoxin